jgi:hypothetical protein
VLARLRQRARQRWQFAAESLTVHLLNHEGDPDEVQESELAHLEAHMRWDTQFARRAVRWAESRDLVTRSGGRLVIAYLPISRKTDKMPGCQKANGDNPNPGNQVESDLQDSNPVPVPNSAPVLSPTPQMVSIKARWGF